MLTVTIAKLSYAITLALCTQPDAKIANGMYWANFWLTLLNNILN